MLSRLARWNPWQLSCLLLLLGVAVALLISGAISLIWLLRPALSVAGAVGIVGWTFLSVRRRRVDEEWI
jgi:hypothetical protein